MDKIKNLVITLNKQALKLIKEASPHSAICRLDQALQVLKMNLAPEYSELYWMTYSNYGLILKKHQKFEQALNCFLIASEYCPEDSVQLAECLLRACNLLAKLKNHKRALDLALRSIKLLKNSDHHLKIVAYQNAGAEYEHLNNKLEARKMYKSGFLFVKKLYGDHNTVALMFKKRYKELNIQKPVDSINIISTKPLRFEQISKTPDLKVNNYKKTQFTYERPSLRLLSKKLNDSGKIHRLTPQLRSYPQKLRMEESSFLKTVKKSHPKIKGKEILDDLFMIDSLKNTPKNFSSKHLDSNLAGKTDKNKFFK